MIDWLSSSQVERSPTICSLWNIYTTWSADHINTNNWFPCYGKNFSANLKLKSSSLLYIIKHITLKHSGRYIYLKVTTDNN